MLQKIMELLVAVHSILSFVIVVAEALWEGQEKAGAEKKKFVMEQFATVRGHVRDVLIKLLGERWAKVVDFVLSDVVISFVIDLMVMWLNRSGIFRTTKA